MSGKRVYVGTSGWTYDDWAGRFYPPKVKGAERLTFYAGRFETVEVNAIFYRIPTQAMIASWNRRLGRAFHLVVKGNRAVTHMKTLPDFQKPLEAFLGRALDLRRLKVILWQLPPSLHKDLDRLKSFLAVLPRTVRNAVEFRHQSWWDEETASLLARYQEAFVAVSHPRLPDAIYPTADFLYVRFHGLGHEGYKYDYSRGELSEWAARLALLVGRRTLYAFFNNDYQAHGPYNAELFRQLLLAHGR